MLVSGRENNFMGRKMYIRLMIFVLLAQLQGCDSGTRGHGKEEGGSLRLFAAVQVKEPYQNKNSYTKQKRKCFKSNW